jgi:hypothetical protein
VVPIVISLAVSFEGFALSGMKPGCASPSNFKSLSSAVIGSVSGGDEQDGGATP